MSVQGRAGAGNRIRGTASPDPFLRRPEDFPHAGAAVAACPALRCLSKVLHANTALRVLLLDLKEAESQIKVPAVWQRQGAAPGAPSRRLV